MPAIGLSPVITQQYTAQMERALVLFFNIIFFNSGDPFLTSTLMSDYFLFYFGSCATAFTLPLHQFAFVTDARCQTTELNTFVPVPSCALVPPLHNRWIFFLFNHFLHSFCHWALIKSMYSYLNIPERRSSGWGQDIVKDLLCVWSISR